MSNVFIGRYKVIEELGRGGMGIVYRAEDPALDRPVAIKVLPPKKLAQQKAIKRFLREARLCAKLDHPNIIKIHDIGEEEGIYHIVMEYVDGRSLREIIEDRDSTASIDINEMLEIFRDVSEALTYAHEKKIVHRDLKPDNIMLTKEGRVKVMDFGLAVLEDKHSLTEMGQVMGTIAYFSPEQARGEAADHRSDIYSLGAVLFEMLTNQLVFQATNPGEMIAKHLTSPPPNPKIYNPKIPPIVVNMILMTLKKNPEERIQSAQALIEMTNSVLNPGLALTPKPQNGSRVPQVPFQHEEEPVRQAPSPDSPGNFASFESGYVPESIIAERGDPMIYDDDPIPPYRIPEPEPPREEVGRAYDDTPSGGSFALPNKIEPSPGFSPGREDPGDSDSPRVDKQDPHRIDMKNPQQRGQSPRYFDRTEEMILKIPVNPEPVKQQPVPPKTGDPKGQKPVPPQSIKPTAGENPVASSQWMEEAQQAHNRWGKYKYMADKVKKDEVAREAAGVGEATLLCPRCGAENETFRRYCRECGNSITQEQFIAQKEAIAHNEKGKELLKQRMREEAAEEFRRATLKDPGLVEAFMNLGKVLGELEKYKDARAAYRSASKIHKDDPKPHILIGDLYRLENRRDDAIYEYKEASKLAPNDINIRSQLALLYSQKGDINKAIDAYQRILVIDPDNLEAHRQLGYLFMSQDKVKEAIKEFEIVIKRDPNDDQVYQALGQLYLKVGRLGNAEQVFQSVLTVNPDDPEAMAALGEIYEKQNRVDLALDQLNTAVKRDASNVEARKKLATIYTKHNRSDLAVRELEEAVRYDPTDPEIHKNLGDVYLKAKQVDKALLHFEQTVNLSPQSAEMHHKLAKLYGKKDYSELSVNEFKKATELEPYNPEYREDLSMAFYQQSRYEEAISEMKKASTLDSTNTDYKKALGVMYEETNQLDKAREQFIKVIDNNPRDAMAQGMLGRVYSKQNLLRMAVLQYEKALQLNPDSYLFHIYLGKAYSQQGRLKEAVDMFRRAIELAPGGSAAKGSRILGKAYADLGRVYLAQGEHEKALDVLKSAESNNPSDPKTLHFLGMLYADMKRYDLAHDYLAKSLKASPNNAEVMRDLSFVCKEQGNLTFALSLIRKSIIHAPADIEGYEILATILKNMGRYPEAQQALSDAVHNCHNTADYAFWLKGNLAAEKRDWEQAMQYYQEATTMNDTVWYYFRDLGVVLEQLEEYGRAVQELNNAITCDPEEAEIEKLRSKINRIKKKAKK